MPAHGASGHESLKRRATPHSVGTGHLLVASRLRVFGLLLGAGAVRRMADPSLDARGLPVHLTN